MADKKRTRIDSSEIKNWVMFLFALGLLWGMFRRGDDLNAWWTLIIGAMLSLTSLMVAVENITTLLKRGPNGTNGRKRDDGGEDTNVNRRADPTDEASPPDQGLLRLATRGWKRGSPLETEVASGRDADLLDLGGPYPGSVQWSQ